MDSLIPIYKYMYKYIYTCTYTNMCIYIYTNMIMCIAMEKWPDISMINVFLTSEIFLRNGALALP